MKKNVIMALALTLALVATPVGNAFATVVSATSNNTVTETPVPPTATPVPSTPAPVTPSSNNTVTVTPKPQETVKPQETQKPAATNSGNNTVTGGSTTTTTPSTSTNTPAAAGVSNSSTVSLTMTTTQSALAGAAGAVSGQTVKLFVAESSVDAGGKQVITNMASAYGAKIAKYIDIAVSVINSDNTAKNVSELKSAVTMVVPVPAGVDTATHDFAVIRMHEGKATLLKDIDSDPATITFQSDKFSVYAIVYGDKGAFNASTTNKEKDNVPKTGDTTVPAAPFAAVGVACLAAAVVLKKKEQA